ncbi:hypothetical protein IMG5_161320 [Ichthyophthirius multifiliis]|uniref:glutaminase n=1 Tax=Ichthyophthirius multifiliis TaxID=5932 RepID=G0R024_ICHMU|nr:hypothetical protein IMG5_161320 [Ichthyophthirius multifiliis]EGR29182.1 hypothetical protein IMG5_161320 [Ichthyophthirius multifiliis]|eukprot:XP_004030418.1 hypothetical protein IMG5_161320 [Ichthyophthirius multifiliis]
MLDSMGVLSHYSLHKIIRKLQNKGPQDFIYFQEYQQLTNGLHFLKKVFESDLNIPSFDRFARNFKECAHYVKKSEEYSHGKTAQYIPTLKNFNPSYFSASFCSNNGQYIEYGDTQVTFSIQSISKIVSYGYLYDLIGEEVHQYIGEEPSGMPFNAPVFDQKGRPHNPMINSGAIMVAALLLEHGKTLEDILEFYQRATRKDLCKQKIQIDHKLYLEEKLTGYTNHALSYLMLANGVFPKKDKNIEQMKEFAQQALDLYFQMCSIIINVESLTRFGTMCSNNGINPSTGERILKPESVKAITTFMLTCGMYNGAGKFTKNLGIPCKSGVSGGLLTIIPGLGSFASFGPKLNEEGNSIRGIGLIKQISNIYNNFNLFHKDLNKKDCENKAFQTIIKYIIGSISCASIGDMEGIIRLKNFNIQLNQGDYDKRTPLHLAASGGHIEIVGSNTFK